MKRPNVTGFYWLQEGNSYPQIVQISEVPVLKELVLEYTGQDEKISLKEFSEGGEDMCLWEGPLEPPEWFQNYKQPGRKLRLE